MTDQSHASAGKKQENGGNICEKQEKPYSTFALFLHKDYLCQY